jgi:hypothetical protein
MKERVVNTYIGDTNEDADHTFYCVVFCFLLNENGMNIRCDGIKTQAT